MKKHVCNKQYIGKPYAFLFHFQRYFYQTELDMHWRHIDFLLIP